MKSRILDASYANHCCSFIVRDQLSQRFGVDLTIKKGFINEAIERTLTNSTL